MGQVGVAAVAGLIGSMLIGSGCTVADPASDPATGKVFGDQVASKNFGGHQFDIPDPAQGGRGGEVYRTVCAACHDEGLERAPQRALFSDMSPQSIYRALTDGRMKDQARGLSDADRIAVAEFVTRKKIGSASEAPEPPSCQGEAARFDFDEPPMLAGANLSRGNTRFVPASVAGIDKASAGRLRLKWAVAFPNATQVRSEPAPAGGALFVGSHNGGVYALDRLSGCARWIYQAGSEVRTGIIVSPWRAGDRSAKPLLYFGDIFGYVYAVDALNGQLVWRTRADEHPNTTITGSPTLDADTLYVPVSAREGARAIDPSYECCTSRGAVIAYHAATGEVKWKTHTVGVPQVTGTNAKGAKQYGPSGANVWNSPTVDAKRQQLYFGTAPNASSPATDTSDAVMALDLTTGAIKWVYQGLAGDAMNGACFSADKTNCPKENGPDLDFGGASAMLVTTPQGRELVIAGQKSGVVHALDPDTGKLVWKEKPGRGGMLGGVHFGMAANEQSVFVPISDAPDGQAYAEPAKPGVYALDLASGKAFWSAPSNQEICSALPRCVVGYSQAITATPDLVFAGSGDGWLRVMDAHSGAVLWEIDTKTPFKTITGEEKTGGSFGGGAGPVVYRGAVFASSGYSLAGQRPGNLLLAFEAE